MGSREAALQSEAVPAHWPLSILHGMMDLGEPNDPRAPAL